MLTRKAIAHFHRVHPDTLNKLIKLSGLKINRSRITVPEYEILKKTVLNPLFLGVSREKLSYWYGIHPETFSAWLKRLGIIHRNKLSHEEIKLVYQECGIPDTMKREFPKEVEEFLSS